VSNIRLFHWPGRLTCASRLPRTSLANHHDRVVGETDDFWKAFVKAGRDAPARGNLVPES